MRWRLFGVVVLAVMAGCSGFIGGEGGSESVSTLTPAPVPTDPPRSGPGSTVVPGVQAGGSLNVSKLVEAHREELMQRGFAWRIRRNRTGHVNGTTESVVKYRQVSLANATHFHYETNGRMVRYQRRRVYYSTYAEYADGEYVYVRGVSAMQGGIRWDRYPVSGARSRFVKPTTAAIEWYFDVEQVSVSQFTTDGEFRYRLTTTDVPASLNGSVRSYTATAVVTPDGLVRNLTATYRTSRGSVWGTIWYTHVYSFRVTDVGNVTVPEPDWLGTAREQFGEPADPPTSRRSDAVATVEGVSG